MTVERVVMFSNIYYRVNEGEFVDSIKWYKDGAEFYRILSHPPREEDKIVTFPRPGIKLDREKSGVSSSS